MSEPTSKLTIGELPNEVMFKILRYLDQSNLTNAILTCKYWLAGYYQIESSCQWSLKLNFDYREYSAEKLDFALITSRKFGTIIELKQRIETQRHTNSLTKIG